MNNIVKICKVHGELTEKLVRKTKKGQLLCRICRKDYITEYNKKNRDKILQQLKVYNKKRCKSDKFIESLLKKNCDETISQEIINLKRQAILINRQLREAINKLNCNDK